VPACGSIQYVAGSITLREAFLWLLGAFLAHPSLTSLEPAVPEGCAAAQGILSGTPYDGDSVLSRLSWCGGDSLTEANAAPTTLRLRKSPVPKPLMRPASTRFHPC